MSVVALFAAASSSYAQGIIAFGNSTATTPITYGGGANLGSRVFGASGTYEYGLYVGAAGATTLSQMVLIQTQLSLNATSATATFAGVISGTATGQGNVGAANGFAGLVAGTTYAFYVAGWTHANGADYLSAVATGDSTGFAGLSALGSIVATQSPTPNAQAFGSGAGQIGGFALNPITSTPEPGTLVLGGLGAASLLLFRRRKN
ncbi:MAG: hypothetical protein JWR26_2979 [Pedosphaera sp.]|nr:hypothetical protein [Pedosphaera sp.]